MLIAWCCWWYNVEYQCCQCPAVWETFKPACSIHRIDIWLWMFDLCIVTFCCCFWLINQADVDNTMLSFVLVWSNDDDAMLPFWNLKILPEFCMNVYGLYCLSVHECGCIITMFVRELWFLIAVILIGNVECCLPNPSSLHEIPRNLELTGRCCVCYCFIGAGQSEHFLAAPETQSFH